MSDGQLIGPKARIRNPVLERLAFLIGDWDTTGTHPQLQGKTLRGKTRFEWHEGGAFLLMRTEVHEPEFPDGIAIFGSDDTQTRVALSYFDERGTSRLFVVKIGEQKASWWRDDAVLAQTVEIEAVAGGNELRSRGRMSQKGGEWTDDLSQVFTRATR